MAYPWLFGAYNFVVIGLLLVVRIAFAIGVYRDANLIVGRIRFAGPLIWTLATLAGGITAVGVYWVIHHFNFRSAPASPESN